MMTSVSQASVHFEGDNIYFRKKKAMNKLFCLANKQEDSTLLETNHIVANLKVGNHINILTLTLWLLCTSHRN